MKEEARGNPADERPIATKAAEKYRAEMEVIREERKKAVKREPLRRKVYDPQESILKEKQARRQREEQAIRQGEFGSLLVEWRVKWGNRVV